MNAANVRIRFTVNGVACNLTTAPSRTLLDVLRDDLGLLGTKCGCGRGECGSCTVHLGGRAVSACMVLAPDLSGAEVLTIEGIGKAGQLHPLARALADEGATLCGFCTPGMVMQAIDLLARIPFPTPEQIREGMAGNLCRCGGYRRIEAAILKTTGQMKQERFDMIREAVKRKSEKGGPRCRSGKGKGKGGR